MRTRWEAKKGAAAVLRLRGGETVDDVARSSGIPAATLRTWRRGPLPRRIAAVLDGSPPCPSCGGPDHDFGALSSDDYAYLLGVYLGDGCLWGHPRGVYSLRIVLDAAYPEIIAAVAGTVGRIRGRPPSVAPDPRGQACSTVVSYSKGWPCLLPQHGPGRKHERSIVLQPWQQEHVRAAPEAFLRGLIHTDGWRGTNRVTAKGRRYEYPRYQFSNRSDDIRALFCEACDALGIAWRPWGRWHVSVARRDAVARMDAFIGPKA